MLDYASLLALLPTLPLPSFSGQDALYRAIALEALYGFHQVPPYAVIRPLYNLGAPAAGARFTPRGGMKSLYLAAHPETAFAEVNQFYTRLRQQNPPRLALTRPTVLLSVLAQIERVLDLTDPGIQAQLQTNTGELNGSWRDLQNRGLPVPTQQLGQAAFDCGVVQALRYTSAQWPGHVCYAVFTDRLAGASFVEVYDPDGNLRERLP